MAELSNNEKLSTIVSMIGEKADTTAHAALESYLNSNDGKMVDTEVRDLVFQRAHSELMLRMCAFKAPEGVDVDELRDCFDAWFATEEQEKLSQMCSSLIVEETKKRMAKGEESMSFSERYRKQVRENHPNAVTLNNMLKD